jgi:hypothetical protein
MRPKDCFIRWRGTSGVLNETYALSLL